MGYRQAKRLWKRYRAGGAANLKHGNAGRISNRARPAKERKKILRKVEEKYSSFGPTLAAEHLSAKTRCRFTRRPCGAGCWRRGCGGGRANASSIASGAIGERISANWCRWTAAFMTGIRGGLQNKEKGTVLTS